MKIIQNNPYRIAGLLVGATAREQDRQIKRLNQFIQAQEVPHDDYSFPMLGKIQRSLELVSDAASKLNLDSERMIAALFWFYKGNPISDEPAFDAIKDADLDEVVNIWTKLTSNGEVSQRNASAHCNLGTLYLSGILDGTDTSEVLLEKGITLKLKFLESDLIKDFKELATGETYKASKKDLQILFLNQAQIEIENTGHVSLNKFVDILIKQDFSAKEDFLKSFVLKLTEQIDKEIENSKTNRKANRINAVKIAEDLYKNTSKNLIQLKSILGVSNIKYSSIADKVANEILQCSIDYFNYFQEIDSESDYFEPAWNIAKKAEIIALGRLTKDRIQDSLNTLAEMKDKEISQAIELLQSVKDAYEANKIKITQQARSIPLGYNQSINWTKVNEMIENSLDWNKVVELILKVIPEKNVEKIRNGTDSAKVNRYKGLVDFLLSKLSYNNKNRIKYICYWKTTTSSDSPGKSGGGCYIATMAYGSYDHPQVLILRQFRDDILDKSQIGKRCIKIYYRYSPILVEKLKDKKSINTIIRKTLNLFIKLIK